MLANEKAVPGAGKYGGQQTGKQHSPALPTPPHAMKPAVTTNAPPQVSQAGAEKTFITGMEVQEIPEPAA